MGFFRENDDTESGIDVEKSKEIHDDDEEEEEIYKRWLRSKGGVNTLN